MACAELVQGKLHSHPVEAGEYIDKVVIKGHFFGEFELQCGGRKSGSIQHATDMLHYPWLTQFPPRDIDVDH